MISELLAINKSDVKLRNNYDVINDVLFCCSDRWLARTNIYSYINLTHGKRYLIAFLVNKGLLCERMNPSYKNKKQLKTTVKGLSFCRLYYKMVGLI